MLRQHYSSEGPKESRQGEFFRFREMANPTERRFSKFLRPGASWGLIFHLFSGKGSDHLSNGVVCVLYPPVGIEFSRELGNGGRSVRTWAPQLSQTRNSSHSPQGGMVESVVELK